MLAETAKMIRKNPLLLVIYLLYMALTISLVFLILPDRLDQTDIVALLLATVKLLVYCIIIAVAGLVFFSGYGNMLSMAANNEKATLASFGIGLRKYILRMLLAGLLLVAIVICFSIAISILLIPVMLVMSMGAAEGNISAISLVSTLITSVLTIFLMPFITLWYPAIFSGDVKITEALKRGARTGVKCYGKLLLLTFVVYLPSLIYMAVSTRNLELLRSGSIVTPSYVAVTAASVILSFIYMCAIFILYRDKYQPDEYYPRQNF